MLHLQVIGGSNIPEPKDYDLKIGLTGIDHLAAGSGKACWALQFHFSPLYSVSVKSILPMETQDVSSQ
jgi:hypothetical protein